MIVALFRRRLEDGASFEDFIEAREADKGFGVSARVFTAVSMEDPRQIDLVSEESLLASLR